MDIPILMFHSVTVHPITRATRGVHVAKDEFELYMEYLAWLGYQSISCADLIAIRSGARGAPAKPVVLTFDDGYAELYENVYPQLAVRHWGYTVLLVADKIGGVSDWPGGAGEPLLSSIQIREMQAAGVDFGAHTLSHPSLPEIEPDVARSQVQDSKKALEDLLHCPIRSFAYPYGHYNRKIRDMVEEAGYSLGLTTELGRVRPDDHPQAMPRVSVYHVPPVSLKFGPRLMNFRWRLEKRKDTRPASS